MKALFFSQDPERITLLNNFLKSQFPRVEFNFTGHEHDAYDFLTYNGPYFLVIIDAAIKDVEPATVAENIVDQYGERPILFLGNKVILHDRIPKDQYLKNKLVQVCELPFQAEKFSQHIRSALEWAKQENFGRAIIEVNPDDYTPIKLRNFYLFNQAPADVFAEITSSKYMLVLSANKPYNEAEIRAISSRNIRTLYMAKTEHFKFLQDTRERITKLLESKAHSGKQMIKVQITCLSVIHQHLKAFGISEEICNLSNTFIDSIADNFIRCHRLANLIIEFPLENRDIAEQSVLTAYACESMAQYMGWGSDMSRKKLGLASILCDSTLSNEKMALIKHLADPKLSSFSAEDVENFKQHPLKASSYCQYFNGFNETEFLLQEHHELPGGSGFPREVNANNLTLISCIFILANNFSSLLCQSTVNKAKLRALSQYLSTQFNGGNFKEPLKHLSQEIKEATSII